MIKYERESERERKNLIFPFRFKKRLSVCLCASAPPCFPSCQPSSGSYLLHLSLSLSLSLSLAQISSSLSISGCVNTPSFFTVIRDAAAPGPSIDQMVHPRVKGFSLNPKERVNIKWLVFLITFYKILFSQSGTKIKETTNYKIVPKLQ